MSDHAFLSPSAAATWTRCRGYPKMTAKYPSKDSAASREGTDAHAVAYAYAKMGREFAELEMLRLAGTDEMLDGAEMYAAHINSLIDPDAMPEFFYLEKRVQVKAVHPDKCFGTPDFWMFSKRARRLDVIDYKFGHGFVDVFENYQLMLYALGALDVCGAMGPIDIVLHIVQPRCYHRDGPVRSWKITTAQLDSYAKIIRLAADRAMEPTPPLTPGDHCKYCPARHACPALHKAAMAAADYSTEMHSIDLDERQVGMEITWIRDAKAVLETRLSGLEELAFAKIASGKNVIGYRVEQKVGRLEWAIPADTVNAVGVGAGLQLMKPAEPITPTQAIKAGLDKALVDSMSERKPGKNELVPDRDAKRFFSTKA